MISPKLANLINNTVRDAVLRTHRKDSCIASTFVLREVLRIGFNLKLEPRAVTLTIYNPFVSAKLKTGEVTTTEDLIAQVRSPEGWSVGIGFGAEAEVNGEKWAGHLVGITRHEDKLLLWDPSLDQANRPHKNMHLAPLVTPIRFDPYIKDEEIRLSAFDCFMAYVGKEEGSGVLNTSPDWIQHDRFQSNIAQALRDLAAAGAPVGDYYEG